MGEEYAMDFHLVVHRLCKIIGIRHYYENEYGIKEHNKKPFELNSEYPIEMINPDIVLLGFDGLKDKYTLVGVPIPKSPHYELMRLIENGYDISSCEYVIREEKGYLDGRYGVRPINHYLAFSKAKKNIKNNDYSPVLIYQIDDQYYAFDGKHRLALCSLIGVYCKCKIINLEEFKKDDHTNRLYRKIKKLSGYSQNVRLLDQVFEGSDF